MKKYLLASLLFVAGHAFGQCTSAPTGAWASSKAASDTPVLSGSDYASYKLPIASAPNKVMIFSGVNSPAPGTAGLLAQFSLSTCPGDFSGPAKCQVTGRPENGAISLTAHTATSDKPYCTVVTGTQYYFNVRNLNCPAGARCSEIVQLHGN